MSLYAIALHVFKAKSQFENHTLYLNSLKDILNLLPNANTSGPLLNRKVLCLLWKASGPYLLNRMVLCCACFMKSFWTIVKQKGSVLFMKRQMKKCLLGGKFKLCSSEIKIQLFQSFCANLYCYQFRTMPKGRLLKITFAYNYCFRSSSTSNRIYWLARA